MKWQKNNPDKVRNYKKVSSVIRKTRELKNGGTFTVLQWEILIWYTGGKCLDCKKVTSLTVDHIIPISKGGSSNISNLQPLCRSCNGRKRDKIIDYRSEPILD